MVSALERVVASGDEDYATIVAGSALFILYSRARVGDVARSQCEPTLDVAQDRSIGFCQEALLQHKTAKPGSKQSLPLVAPIFGITGAEWASPWLEARTWQRLHAHGCTRVLQSCRMRAHARASRSSLYV